MKEWFNSYPGFLQAVVIIAIVASAIMLVQIVLLLIGMGSETSFDGGEIDDPSDIDDVINDNSFLDVFGLRILTVRNFIAFFAIGGWSALVFYDITKIVWVSIIVGVCIGIATMFLMAYVFKKAMGLQASGNIDIKNAIGKKGVVYLTIPASKTGKGKINVTVQDRYIEVDAMTDEDVIPTGTEVEIIDCINDYLIVKKVN